MTQRIFTADYEPGDQAPSILSKPTSAWDFYFEMFCAHSHYMGEGCDACAEAFAEELEYVLPTTGEGLNRLVAEFVEQIDKALGLPFALTVVTVDNRFAATGGDTRLAGIIRAGIAEHLRGKGATVELSEYPDGLLPERPVLERRDHGGKPYHVQPYPTGEPVGGG